MKIVGYQFKFYNIETILNREEIFGKTPNEVEFLCFINKTQDF